MKTKTILSFFLIVTISIQNLSAQSLRKKLIKNIQEISEQFNTITEKRKKELVQIAFKIHESSLDKDRNGVVFIDKHNTQNSQLAMIWLKTAFNYYNLTIDVNSAGIEENSNKPLTNLSGLSNYGFTVKNANMKNSNKYWVGYGHSTSWLVFSKTFTEVKANQKSTVNILVDDLKIDNDNINLKLEFSDNGNLPLHILYIASHINNLIKN